MNLKWLQKYVQAQNSMNSRTSEKSVGHFIVNCLKILKVCREIEKKMGITRLGEKIEDF